MCNFFKGSCPNFNSNIYRIYLIPALKSEAPSSRKIILKKYRKGAPALISVLYFFYDKKRKKWRKIIILYNLNNLNFRISIRRSNFKQFCVMWLEQNTARTKFGAPYLFEFQSYVTLHHIYKYKYKNIYKYSWLKN